MTPDQHPSLSTDEPPRPSKHLVCVVSERVATITLDRPDALNALSREMREGLQVLLEWCGARQDQIRAVVLAGTGRAFCAGQDLKESEGAESVAGSLEAKRAGDFQTVLADLPQPTIAALHGHVLGRGLEVALTCDLRIASTDARLGLPETGLGMIPASGGSQRLPRLIGPARALDLLLTGETISAETAAGWGLVTRVVLPEKLAAAAQALGERLATLAPLALRFGRRAILEGGGLPLADGLRLEAALAAVLRTTADRREGIDAFRERRPARFRGE